MAQRRAAILLAAGESSRMGSSKALLPWAGTSLLGYAVGEFLAAGAAEVVVVVGADAERVRAALPSSDAVVAVANPEYRSGRSSSIRAGAASISPATSAVIVQSVDQPCPSAILRALYEAVEQPDVEVAAPTFAGRRGHPICLAGRLVSELLTVREEDEGLRAAVRRHAGARRDVPVESAVVHLNLNDRSAYERAYQESGDGIRSPRAGTEAGRPAW
jgi:molybdenum cofactor cytidylyltransferase